MSVNMCTSFADGTKVAFEQASTANATGMQVAQRGMLAYESTDHVDRSPTAMTWISLRSWVASLK